LFLALAFKKKIRVNLLVLHLAGGSTKSVQSVQSVFSLITFAKRTTFTMTILALETYNIHIGTIHESHIEWLRDKNYAGIAILMDENTAQHCWPKIEDLFAPFSPTLIKIQAGEINKTLESCQYIWQQLFDIQAGRRWCLINLGGGVIGDMGGFCASTFKRGIDFIQIPTTILSQVDASVGGKLGIDFYGVKNSIGVFQNPIAVWADPQFFETLPTREIRSGFAEILKHALIADAEQWEELLLISELNKIDWTSWVARSVSIKRSIVEEDPHEHGLRKALNFGHTIGHAVESYFLDTEKHLLHGEAIAIGMICEAWISVQQLGLREEELQEITSLLLWHYGHQFIPAGAYDELIATMKQDKKNTDARIAFSLLPAIGEVEPMETAEELVIMAALDFYNRLGH